MFNLVNKLMIKGYPKFTNGDVSGSCVATFVCQLNPDQFSVSFDINTMEEESQEPKNASGVPVADKGKAYNRQQVSFEFIIDNTGVLPIPPSGAVSALSPGLSIQSAIEQLQTATIKPTSESHMPPFVHVLWSGSVNLKGRVTQFTVTYLHFDRLGFPLRAKVSMSVVEVVDDQVVSREFRSPDITRMPTIREGDSLVAMCHEFYDDPKYFIRVAEFNNLPTFRRLKVGSTLQFPPLEK
jgi:hypothetical protein